MTFSSLARKYGSTHSHIIQILENKYGEIPELTKEVEQVIKYHLRKRKPIKKKQIKEVYKKAYVEMQEKGYFTYEDMAERFGKSSYEQMKCNFDNNGFFVYDGYKRYLKKGFPEGTEDVKAWGKTPVIMPCFDKDGNWIADKEII